MLPPPLKPNLRQFCTDFPFNVYKSTKDQKKNNKINVEHGGWLCPPLNATWSAISRCPRQQEQPPPTGCRISSLIVHREKSVRKVFKPSWPFWRPLQVANMALEKESVSDEFGLRDLQVVQLLLLLMFQNWVAFLHISSLDQDEISLCNFHLVTSPRRRSPSLDYR